MSPVTGETDLPPRLDALIPRGAGHQFVLAGDACSGVPGRENERLLARTNEVIQKLDPPPEFVVFAGDEIVGLTTSPDELHTQWRHWFEVEMGWLDRSTTPLYNTTSNHTTYDTMSERVFTEALSHLPDNGPEGQRGLSYAVRHGDLLLVAVHTSWTGLGGEGHVETEWLAETLARHADARFRFVTGHHPVFPVNGFAGEHQRELDHREASVFWDLLVATGVDAYLCSHILAFDVQAERGVLQVTSAGAGTPHRMPEGIEYHHAVQLAIDGDGLRLQVIDHGGRVRERLSWPPTLPPSSTWSRVGWERPLPALDPTPGSGGDRMVAWRFQGRLGAEADAGPRPLVVTEVDGTALPAIWIGVTGSDRCLTIIVGPEPGRSPHSWFGPSLGTAGERFDLQVALHLDMGPGGVLWRAGDDDPWSSLTSSSPWGVERLRWPLSWSDGAVLGQDLSWCNDLAVWCFAGGAPG